MSLSEPALLSIAKRHMATDFEFEVVVEASTLRKGESVLHEAHALVDLIEDELTEFRASSPVYRLNHSEIEEWIPLSPILSDVLSLSKGYAEFSQYRFSPFAKSTVPSSFSDLEMDGSNARIRRRTPGVHLGLGAIGKGYALDQVRDLIEREGFQDYRLNSGGSSWVFGGFDPNRRPWEISWAWDRDSDGDYRGHRYRLPPGKPLAIGVSGVLEQGNHFFHGGKLIPSAIRSTFYCGRSAAEADALSTALFVGASLEGEKILTKLNDRIRAPILAYVDLNEGMFYNQAFETCFLRGERIQ